MTIHLCITHQRWQKTTRIMEALAAGIGPDARICAGAPPDDGEPFVVWGQQLLAAEIVPGALAAGRPCWHIDNGFWDPARGGEAGYYRMTYRGLSAILLKDAPSPRLEPRMAPWRSRGRAILLAAPGPAYGAMIGLDMAAWTRSMHQRLLEQRRRPLIYRPKGHHAPVAHHLAQAWALVTHSSNVAVEAAVAGVPVFVAPTSPAAPVGNTDMSDFEATVMPDRRDWWASLMCQQFTLDEMADGTAARCMAMIREQVDG